MTSRAEAEQLLQHIYERHESGDLFQWGVALNSSDKIIGTCTLFQIDRQNARAEVGYALGREFWGQGLMNEAVASAIDFAFNQLYLRRLEADVDPRNTNSIKILERFGFVREGYLREKWFVGREVQDSLIFGLLNREWKARNKI